MRKVLWNMELILAILAAYSFTMCLIQLGDCQNQVDFSPRGNVWNVLLPIGWLPSSTRAVLEDSNGDFYIGDLGIDTDTIQKFSSEGKYICSYFVNNKERQFWIEKQRNLQVKESNDTFQVFLDGKQISETVKEEEGNRNLQKFIQKYGTNSMVTDLVCVFSSNEIVLYAKDCLLGEIPLSDEEQTEFSSGHQESEGSLHWLTVRMHDGRTIQLEKILNSDVCFGGVFGSLVTLAIVIGSVLFPPQKDPDEEEESL